MSDSLRLNMKKSFVRHRGQGVASDREEGYSAWLGEIWELKLAV